MLIRTFDDCREFVSGDNCLLREYLHPDKHAADIRYSLAIATVKPGGASTAHVLHASEVYYIINGRGVMHVDDEAKEVGPLDAVYIPAEATQWIENTGEDNLAFLCIVDPPWEPEIEEVFDG